MPYIRAAAAAMAAEGNAALGNLGRSLNELEARRRHHGHHGHWQGHHSGSAAVSIIAIIFGSGVIIFALSCIVYLVKLHIHRKTANVACNGNCRCKGDAPPRALETPPPYANKDAPEEQRGLLDASNEEDLEDQKN